MTICTWKVFLENSGVNIFPKISNYYHNMCLGLFFDNHITCIKILLGKSVSQCLHEESFEINVH